MPEDAIVNAKTFLEDSLLTDDLADPVRELSESWGKI
jgi:hypothetical protein